MRILKEDPLYHYLLSKMPELIEDEIFRPHDTAVLSIPIKSPKGAKLRTESPITLLNRIRRVSQEWVSPGFRHGSNTHNVSATVNLKDDEWKEVVDWMWENKNCYNGLSVLPYDGGSYEQAPFEDITHEKYLEMSEYLTDIDLTEVSESKDDTDLKGELACAGNNCEIV